MTKQDIHIINTRFVGNINFSLSPVIKLKCTCYRSNERNAYTNIIFLQHWTHEELDDKIVDYPNYVCIIKGSIRYKNK